MNVYGKFTNDVVVWTDLALLPEGLYDCFDDAINAIMMKYTATRAQKFAIFQEKLKNCQEKHSGRK